MYTIHALKTAASYECQNRVDFELRNQSKYSIHTLFSFFMSWIRRRTYILPVTVTKYFPKILNLCISKFSKLTKRFCNNLQMGDVDPELLLEWLSMGQGDERDMQLIALEQLCMLLLMSDNVDRCFESCPPRTFLPALCKIFLDELAPENVLEVTARAITYYLDVSAECTRRIVAIDGAIKAICNRLVVADLTSRTSRDLAEQCIKVLELICTREAGAVFEGGGLNCVLSFIRDCGSQVHKDTLHSSMAVVSRLCTKVEPQSVSIQTCVESLSTLLQHEDTLVADGALKCFASVADRFTRKGVDPAPLAEYGNLFIETIRCFVSH